MGGGAGAARRGRAAAGAASGARDAVGGLSSRGWASARARGRLAGTRRRREVGMVWVSRVGRRLKVEDGRKKDKENIRGPYVRCLFTVSFYGFWFVPRRFEPVFIFMVSFIHVSRSKIYGHR
jgi:hypothetical protein